MTLQQDKWCYYYALYEGQHGAQAKANKAAEFKDPHTGSRLLKNPEIIKKIEEYKVKIKEEVEMSAKDIIARLQKVAKREVPYDGSVKDAREALKDLAKYKGIEGFTDKLVIEHRDPFAKLTWEELIALRDKGIIPKGFRPPEITMLSQIISGGKPEESGETSN